ncbi:MAG: hypothetical protein ABJE66_10670 [Deltaproteobacteria bacterium]
MPRVVVVSALLSVATATVAGADPLASDRRDDSRIGATVGLFTPTGELGVEYTRVFHPNFELGLGAGVGLVRVGPQASVMPRLRVRRGPFTLSGGAGLSVGRFNNISAFADENAPRVLSLFANGEVGFAISSTRGPFVRGFLGAGKIVAHEQVTDAYRSELKDVIPYGGITFGWTF